MSSGEKQKEQANKQFYSNIKSLASKRNKMEEEIQKNEQSIYNFQIKIHDKEQRMNNISLDKAKIVAEIEGLKKEFEQYSNGKIRRNIQISQY